MNTIEFLKAFHPNRPWVLTAIAPDQKIIETHAFLPEHEKAATDWIAEWNGKRNLYFSVAEPILLENKKIERENVQAVHWLHVDLDAQAGKDFLSEMERIKALTTSIPTGIPKPTCVVFSGGGYQLFWRLKEQLVIAGNIEAAETAARYNKQLEIVLGGDHCSDVSRIMRLPGTMNIPNAKKVARGRIAVHAEVVTFTKSSYDLSAFTMAADVGSVASKQELAKIDTGNLPRLASVDDLDQWKVPDRLKVVIVQGRDPDNPKGGDDSRSAWLLDAVCNLVRHGVPDETIGGVILDSGFKIAESVLDKPDPVRYALRQISRAHDLVESKWLYTLNERFAVIRNLGGKCRIIEEVWEPSLQRHSLSKITFNDFRNYFCNEMETVVTTNAKGNAVSRTMPVGDFWLKHPRRRQYDRLVFAPGRDVDGAYNLWRGYNCNAIPGDKHHEFLEHLRLNICAGNPEHYDYLLNWMAFAVQSPAEPGTTAVVMRGPAGTGKSFFATHFGRLFGRHFMHVTRVEHLLGQFNAHLRDAVIVFGDECFYAGDRKHESVLKTLITESMLMVESKGVDAEVCPNFTHILLASNAEWVIPAGAGDRRFFVVDVADKKLRDNVYFGGLEHDLTHGGYESLLYDLLSRDLSSFRVQDIPYSSALDYQKRLSLEPHEEWYFNCLWRGKIGGEVWDERGVRTQNHLVWEEYIQFCANVAVHRLVNRERLGHYLLRTCPPDWPKAGRHRTDGELQVTRELPALSACRESFDKRYNVKTPWETPDYTSDKDIPF